MKQSIRVLYAEDNPQDADLICNYLKDRAPEFDITVVDTGQGCIERLRAAQFDLLLLDNRLPDMNGSAVLSTLMRNGLQLPVILITGSGDENLVVQALRLGAINYIPKSGNYLETMPDLLHAAIKDYRQKQEQNQSFTLPVRILYLEHLPMDVEMTVQYFMEMAPNFVLDVVPTCSEALLRLRQGKTYDLALINLHLSEQSGIDFIREARMLDHGLPPFIVISAQGDDAAVIAALQLGAVNYIPKREGYLNQLVYTIDHTISQNRLNSVNRQLQAELAERKRVEIALRDKELLLHQTLLELGLRGEAFLQQATHDELTGLPNRRRFSERLAAGISEARRYHRKMAVVFVDIDHFKKINDTLGHNAGDQFLIAIADRIKQVPREEDTCARLGGDEFALILSNIVSKDQVGAVAQRILYSLDKEIMIEGTPLHASASIGVAIFPDDADDAPTILKYADTAMYKSKAQGRNTYHFWDQEMDSNLHLNQDQSRSINKP